MLGIAGIINFLIRSSELIPLDMFTQAFIAVFYVLTKYNYSQAQLEKFNKV